MTTERLDVRLGPDRRRKLTEIAHKKGASVSEVVRGMIDREYDAILREQRLQAARDLAAMQIEDVPDPETLTRQLESTHDLGDLY